MFSIKVIGTEVDLLECAFFDPPRAKWSVFSNHERNSTGSPEEGAEPGITTG